jgi:hypothetical protein
MTVGCKGAVTKGASGLMVEPEERKMRIPIILAVAAFVLSGCNANQQLNSSSYCAGAADCNPYDPSSYAQNQTGRGR